MGHMLIVPRAGICAGVEGFGNTVQEGAVEGTRELRNEADFASIANTDGEISICGFGSLLSGLWKSALMWRSIPVPITM